MYEGISGTEGSFEQRQACGQPWTRLFADEDLKEALIKIDAQILRAAAWTSTRIWEKFEFMHGIDKYEDMMGEKEWSCDLLGAGEEKCVCVAKCSGARPPSVHTRR